MGLVGFGGLNVLVLALVVPVLDEGVVNELVVVSPPGRRLGP